MPRPPRRNQNLNHRGHWVAQGGHRETIEFRALGVSAVAFIQTAFGISPAGPSLPKHPSSIRPLLLPTGQCAPRPLGCAQPPRWPAPAFLLPSHPRQANAHLEILSFRAAAAAPSPVAVRAAPTSATPIAHPPAFRSDACARRGHATRPASVDRAAATRTALQSPDA